MTYGDILGHVWSAVVAGVVWVGGVILAGLLVGVIMDWKKEKRNAP